MARKSDMMHFRLNETEQARLRKAVADHPERYESQSSLIRQALRYYLGRLEAGVLDREPDPKPPVPVDRPPVRRPVPPPTRSTGVAW